MSPAPTDFASDPESIGKYEIVGRLGEGGFGVVWEGRDPYLERRVAVKTCTAEGSELRDRFFREAEIAGNLRHPNIVTVHDFGTQEGVPYLVQEYLSGEDLDQMISRRAPLTVRRRLEILRDAACGLQHAHHQGVIHRDVKPANIRITDKGQIKIMDFGVAKLANVASRLTKTGMALGTAAYLPPEQIRGHGVDHRADIFSFGVTAFELLAYQRPFGGRTISALFFEIIHQPTPSLAERWPECPPALDALIKRCLAKEPEDRYSSFEPLLKELDAIMALLDNSTANQDGTTQVLREQRSSKEASNVFTRVTALVETGDFDGAAREVEEASQELTGSQALELEESYQAALADRLLAQAAAAREAGDLAVALSVLKDLRKRRPDLEEARIREREIRQEIEADTRKAQLATDCATLRAYLKRGEVDRVATMLETVRSTYGDPPELAEIEELIREARAAEEKPPAAEEPSAAPEPATRMLSAEEIGAMREQAAARAEAAPPIPPPSRPTPPPPAAKTTAAPPDDLPLRPGPAPSKPAAPPPQAQRPAGQVQVAKSSGIPWKLLALVGLAFLLFLAAVWLSAAVGSSSVETPEPAIDLGAFGDGADAASGPEASTDAVSGALPPGDELPPGTESVAPLYIAGQEGVVPAALESLPDIDLANPPEGPIQVLLYVLVDENGRVQAVRTLEDGGLDPRSLAIVHDAASTARFAPATRNGVPGQQWTTLRIPIEGR